MMKAGRGLAALPVRPDRWGARSVHGCGTPGSPVAALWRSMLGELDADAVARVDPARGMARDVLASGDAIDADGARGQPMPSARAEAGVVRSVMQAEVLDAMLNDALAHALAHSGDALLLRCELACVLDEMLGDICMSRLLAVAQRRVEASSMIPGGMDGRRVAADVLVDALLAQLSVVADGDGEETEDDGRSDAALVSAA